MLSYFLKSKNHNFIEFYFRPCNCSEGGSYENRPACDSQTGQCICKQNVAGKQCDK